MILEELVSKLGFEVEGLAKLKAASKAFAGVKKDVIATANPLKAIGGASTVAAVGVGKLGTASTKSSRGVLLLSTALGGLRRGAVVAIGVLKSVLGFVLRMVPALLGVVASLTAVGLAFARAGAKAAMARREFALAAKEIGTSAQNLETVGNILRVVGFGEGFEDEAKKVVGAMDEVAKTIKKGGDEADETKKKFKGFGIDSSFNVDPKTGQTRDSAAIALDVFQAYKRATEQAANLRKEADALGNKSPKKASALRKKALEQDQKTAKFTEDSGISGKLKVLLDGITTKQLAALADQAARLFPTTSNKSEGDQSKVADQAVQAGLKTDALMKGFSDRLTEIGVAIATEVLPPLNTFLDTLISFAKRTGLIKETTGEKASRTEQEREANRAKGFGGTREETAGERRARTRQEGEQKLDAERKARNALPARDKDTSPAVQSEGLLQYLKRMISPETNAGKMQKAAEAKRDERRYENIGNDQRTISPSITVNATGLEEVAAKIKASVLGAISTKGANTSTGALTAP